MIDIMYPLGGGSIVGNRELRYSLRSIEKHLTGYRDIYIVGILPSFLKDVRHISFIDEHKCKETNIYRKVLRVSQESSISNDFLFFNDDHFLLQDFVADQFPFYFKNELRVMSKGLRKGGIYKRAVDNTYRVLHDLGYGTKNFDGHCPIIYNKQFVIDRMTKYDWSKRVSYVLKSLYANTKGIGGERMVDCKIGGQHTIESLRDMIARRKYFSMGDGSIGPPLWEVLDELYPNPSRWEKEGNF